MTESHYEVLGVRPDASADEIKRAYRQKAKRYHPDRNDSPAARERFTRIQEAKETLLDAERRRHYDSRRDHQSSTTAASSTETPQHARNASPSSRDTTRAHRQYEVDREDGWNDSTAQQSWTAHRDPAKSSVSHRVDDLRTGYRQASRWFSSWTKSTDAISQLLTEVAASPTLHRLGVTFTLVLVVDWIALTTSKIALTPRVELAVLLVSLVVSYGTYPHLNSMYGTQTWPPDRSA